MDELTGLPTHRDLSLALPALRASNPEASLTGILFDIDGLIWVNDQRGFREGDATLIRVARCLESIAAEHHVTVFRVSGDEFLFLLPRASVEEAARLARNVLLSCELLRIPYSKRGDTRDFLALNAVVFTAPEGFESDLSCLREGWANAIYRTKCEEGTACSVVAFLSDEDLPLPPTAETDGCAGHGS